MPSARTWSQLEALLPSGWSEARVSLRVEGDAQQARVAAILGPLDPGRSDGSFVFRLVASGGVNGSAAVERALAGLAQERIGCVLTLLDTAAAATPAPGSLALAWDAAQLMIPSDWSDVYGEIAIESAHLLERTALLLGPINPHRNPAAVAFRFRAARVAGYGASTGMVRRCLERLDADGIRGTVTILRALCETRPVATQGPQWVEGGKNF